MNVLVPATEISGPACMYSAPSASSGSALPTTLVIAMTLRAGLMRLAHGRKRVGGLAGLRHRDHQ